ncbi:MAG: hypothetical protein V1684_02430 [bacterium]
MEKNTNNTAAPPDQIQAPANDPEIQTEENEDENTEIKNEKAGSENQISIIEFLFIGLIAFGKDSLDGGATLLVIGIPLTPIANISAILSLWLWCAVRLGRFPTKRFMGATVLEFIPLINALPFWTAFMVTLYLQQHGYIPKFLTKNKQKK